MIKTKEGFRALCLSGSFSEHGLTQMGITSIPKVERRGGGGESSRPFTLCARARASLLTADGRVVAVDPHTGRLCAVPPHHPLATGDAAVFTIDGGEGDSIAFRVGRTAGEKGGADRYISVDKATGAATAKWGGWALTRAEMLEVRWTPMMVRPIACNQDQIADRPPAWSVDGPVGGDGSLSSSQTARLDAHTLYCSSIAGVEIGEHFHSGGRGCASLSACTVIFPVCGPVLCCG